MFTLPEFHSYINKANIREKTVRLSPASLEALAIIAYKQPVTRVEIERIRGVDSGGVLKNLMTKELIAIDGKSPAPGNPLLYKTTEYFLEFFGLPSLDHLPPLAEIQDHGDGLPFLKLIKAGEGNDSNRDDTENAMDTQIELNSSEKANDLSANEILEVDFSTEEKI